MHAPFEAVRGAGVAQGAAPHGAGGGARFGAVPASPGGQIRSSVPGPGQPVHATARPAERRAAMGGFLAQPLMPVGRPRAACFSSPGHKGEIVPGRRENSAGAHRRPRGQQGGPDRGQEGPKERRDVGESAGGLRRPRGGLGSLGQAPSNAPGRACSSRGRQLTEEGLLGEGGGRGLCGAFRRAPRGQALSAGCRLCAGPDFGALLPWAPKISLWLPAAIWDFAGRAEGPRGTRAAG